MPSPDRTDLRESIARIADVAPDQCHALLEAHRIAESSAPDELLGLAELLIGTTLDPGHEPGDDGPAVGADQRAAIASWRTAPVFSERERAWLALVEQFIFYVADIDDSLVARLLDFLSPAEVYRLVNALYVIEATQRLRICVDQLFGETLVAA